jgi:hypothetical protein
MLYLPIISFHLLFFNYTPSTIRKWILFFKPLSWNNDKMCFFLIFLISLILWFRCCCRVLFLARLGKTHCWSEVYGTKNIFSIFAFPCASESLLVDFLLAHTIGENKGEKTLLCLLFSRCVCWVTERVVARGQFKWDLRTHCALCCLRKLDGSWLDAYNIFQTFF